MLVPCPKRFRMEAINARVASLFPHLTMQARRFIFAHFAIAAIATVVPTGVEAQYAPSAENDGFQPNEYDAMMGPLEETGLDPIELIHRANLSPGRTVEEFNADQQYYLDEASASFRQRQRHLLEQQSQTTQPE